MGIILKDHKVQWVYRLGEEEPTHLMVDEEIGEQFATVSINRYGRKKPIIRPLMMYCVLSGDFGALSC